MRNRTAMLFVALILIQVTISASIFQQYYPEALKIAQSMSIQQKVGQMLQVDFTGFNDQSGTNPAKAERLFIGSVLIGGNGVADQNGNVVDPGGSDQEAMKGYTKGSLENWRKLANKFTTSFQIVTKTGLFYSIKPILATDAVHNNQHQAGTILFPHNIGISCSHNPKNFYNAGYWTGLNVRNTGFHYAFAPTLAVSHNPQWGRFYQSMGQQPEYIYQYGKQFVSGLQNIKNKKIVGAVGSAKHFFGDGSTLYGADEGSAEVGSYKSYIDHNIQGYIGSIQSDVGTVMTSYSGINYIPMAFGPWLKTLLRTRLNFKGFVISDYDQTQRIIGTHLPTSFHTMQDLSQGIASMIQAGNDMIMLPGFYGYGYIEYFAKQVRVAYESKNITEQRFNDAVARILAVKMSMNLVQRVPKTVSQKVTQIIKEQITEMEIEHTPLKSSSQYEDSLQAVRESLVLLKNSGSVLPMNTTGIEYILFAGQRWVNNELYPSYDNIGMQCGGWTLRWQGFQGSKLWKTYTPQMKTASSIMDGLKKLNLTNKLIYPKYQSFTDMSKINATRQAFLNELKTLRQKMNSKNTVIIGATGQSPYAQFGGDINIPYCQGQDKQGCLYYGAPNPYKSGEQKNTLAIQFDEFDKNVIDTIKQKDSNIPLVSILFAGRPMLINSIIDRSQAVIHAFLPGTSGGQGVVDALTGKYIMRPNGKTDRVNTLSFDWPFNMAQLQNFPIYGVDGKVPKIENPLYSVGYGLSTGK